MELSTEQDARDFASQDITYRVSVSVTDASLREVSASGQVIATCRPFNIFTALNRGYAPRGFRSGPPSRQPRRTVSR